MEAIKVVVLLIFLIIVIIGYALTMYSWHKRITKDERNTCEDIEYQPGECETYKSCKNCPQYVHDNEMEEK